MSIHAAITSCSASQEIAAEAIGAWSAASEELEAIGVDNDFRRGMLIGQCAHESGQFRSRFENLNYSGTGLWRTFRRHFANEAEVQTFIGSQKGSPTGFTQIVWAMAVSHQAMDGDIAAVAIFN